jgi:RHH-type proline utilization regulon transcriptional repressor/proline dehydrogenase/delta 1-pyrroline-5-carboxylate dehydrogenase
MGSVKNEPNRIQNRRSEHPSTPSLQEAFQNTADTDWSLPSNVSWIRAQVNTLRTSQVPTVRLQVSGEFVTGDTESTALDPSRPGFEAYRYALAGPLQVERALQSALLARESWEALGFAGRGEVLMNVASVLSQRRGEAISTMVLDAGKSVMEADAESSEAIDFANYYARSFIDPAFSGSRFKPFGTVLITPPWNFPFAIPCSGILAALAAGNTVIFNPAPETVLTAWVLANALWDAGVPREVLQFLPCPDNEIGRSLVTDHRISAVVLTGSYETARMFLEWKPELRLFAETSGKNAIVITAAADLDLAIKDLVKSAFGHAGVPPHRSRSWKRKSMTTQVLGGNFAMPPRPFGSAGPGNTIAWSRRLSASPAKSFAGRLPSWTRMKNGCSNLA